MDVESGPEGSKKVDLTPEGGESLVGAASTVAGAGAEAESGVETVFFLEVMVD